MPRAKQVAGEKPKLGLPDEVDALRETCRNAQEGNLKLTKSVDALRGALETIVAAEWDNVSNTPVSGNVLRQIAVEGLDSYSRLTGQSWKRHKLIGNRAGDRNLSTLDG